MFLSLILLLAIDPDRLLKKDSISINADLPKQLRQYKNVSHEVITTGTDWM